VIVPGGMHMLRTNPSTAVDLRTVSRSFNVNIRDLAGGEAAAALHDLTNLLTQLVSDYQHVRRLEMRASHGSPSSISVCVRPACMCAHVCACVRMCVCEWYVYWIRMTSCVQVILRILSQLFNQFVANVGGFMDLGGGGGRYGQCIEATAC
jgi:hypothetical protein